MSSFAKDLADLAAEGIPDIDEATVSNGFIKPTDSAYGATGNGVANDTTAVSAAVAAAFANGYDIYWPAGTYLTTASIPNFHNVRHFGPGIIKRGSDLFYISPRPTDDLKLYVNAAAANDLADGLSATTPIKEIRTAVGYLANYRHLIPSNWIISVPLGEYKGGVNVPANILTRNYIKIIGADPGMGAGATLDISILRQGATGSFVAAQTVSTPGGGSGTISGVITAVNGPKAGGQIALRVTVSGGAFAVGETITASGGATAVIAGVRKVPGVRIRHSLDSAQTRGVSASGNLRFWMENVEVEGPFAISETISLNTLYQRRNVHVNGAAVGLDIDNRSTYFNYGGIISGCPTHGISELFSVVRSHDETEKLLIRNCGVGGHVKENTNGHFDAVAFEDCKTGLVMHAWSTTNLRLATFRRNSVAIALINSELHNESSVDFGTGEDVNTITVLPFGFSSEIAGFGWIGSADVITLRAGFRPPILLYGLYPATPGLTHTDTTADTDIINVASLLKRGRYSAQGRRFIYKVSGTIVSTLTSNVTISARASSLLGQVVIPAGAVAQAWTATFEVIANADCASQIVESTLIGDTFQDVQTAYRTLDLRAADASVQLRAQLATSTDSIRFQRVEVFG
jgi:hypothetical protein